MENIGIDLHKRDSQVCVLSEDGRVLLEQRVHTTRERLSVVLSARPKSRVLLEASTESEWVARHLEELGHTVIVANPNFAPMYATRTKRIKTDLRDARVLAEALRLGAYRPAHRASETSRTARDVLLSREALVKNRTSLINLVRAMLRSRGLRLSRGTSHSVADRLSSLSLPADLSVVLSPLIAQMRTLSCSIKELDQQLARAAEENPVTRRLCTTPGVGAITAWTFLSVIDDVDRFATAHRLESYLGLVPSERSSGEKQRRGRLTKTGNRRLRALMTEAAWTFLRSKHPAAQSLNAWASGVASRRGKRVAAVALARRLSGILFAIWRDETVFGAPGQRSIPSAEIAA